MTSEQTTAAAPKAQPAQHFRYEKPDFAAGCRKAVRHIGRTDLVTAAVQIIRKGGETNLHAHSNMDGVWTVLRGRARFYTTGDIPIADLGPMEGVVIPRNYPYWFESTGEEDLELLQFEARLTPADPSAPRGTGRVDFAPQAENFQRMDIADVFTEIAPEDLPRD